MKVFKFTPIFNLIHPYVIKNHNEITKMSKYTILSCEVEVLVQNMQNL